ncbi:MAG: DUF5803 family protein [Salinirussus sp.]
MRRTTVAAGGLVVLALLAGCGLGSSNISEEKLNENATYDWETGADVSFDLSRSSYAAVVSVNNSTSLSVYERDALGTESPVQLSKLRFRYPNGTIVSAEEANLTATLASKRTNVGLPAERGQVAYTASRNGKQFSTPVFVAGTYEITLPAGTRIGIPLLSQAGPGGYETTVEDNRMTVRWAELSSGTAQVRYYLQRDLLLFGGLIGLVVMIGAGGALYYLRQIRRLENQREELGLDVDYEDDPGDRGPPPGMR